MKKHQNHKKEKRRSTLKRLLWANLIAALALLTLCVTVLWALGLLGSMLTFFF